MRTPRAAVPPLVLASLLLSVSRLGAQASVEEGLSRLDGPNANAWVSPLARALGEGLNTGFTSGRRYSDGFSFRLGIRASVTRVPRDRTSFEARLPGTVDFAGHTYQDPWVAVGGEGRTPTAAGGGSGLVLAPRPGSPFENALVEAGQDPATVRPAFPAGLDLDAVPLVLMEGVFGLGGRTDLILRLTPTVRPVRELGEVTVVGAALSRSVIHRASPGGGALDLSVGAGLQRMRAGGWFDALASSLSLSGSAGIGILRAHASVLVSGADVEVRFRPRSPAGVPALAGDVPEVRFRADAPTRTDASAGLGLTLGRAELVADYRFGAGDTAAAGVFLRLR